MRLAIDPGHGGQQWGACANGLVEAHLNMRLAVAVSEALMGSGIDVRLLRFGEITTSLGDRARLAKEMRADLVLSLHHNASTDLTECGLEVYVWPGNALGRNIADLIADRAPTALLPSVVFDTAPPPSGEDWKARARAVVGAYAPTCVLVECGYLTNANDARWLAGHNGAPRRELVECLSSSMVLAEGLITVAN